MDSPVKELLERLLSKIVIDDNQCWIWTGAKSPKGYGNIRVGNKVCRAHRVSYELHKGTITDQLHHLCEVTSCINPEHLVDVDARTNMRYAAGQTEIDGKWYCKRGHLIANYNAMQDFGSDTYIRCRSCKVEGTAIRRQSCS